MEAQAGLCLCYWQTIEERFSRVKADMILDRPRHEKFLTLLHANNKGADQPVCRCSLITSLYYSLSGKYRSKTCSMQIFNIFASLCRDSRDCRVFS